MKENKIFLSVVIPAYNESENFKKKVLDQVVLFLNKQKYKWEVIIVDDGSTDNTRSLVGQFINNKKNWRLIASDHNGKAAAVTKGLLTATGDYILFTDFDQATPIEEATKLLGKVPQNQIVIGSREIAGAKRQKEPIYRHVMGKVFNVFVRILVINGIHDTQCGFKLFSQIAVKTIFPRIQVYKKKKVSDAYTGAFDVELLFLARKNNLAVIEVPVDWHHVKTIRVNPLKDSVRMFFDIVKIRLYDILGRYED